MDAKSLRSLKPELEVFLSRYVPHFGRDENHAHARTIVQGLLAGGERRNVENMAETIEGGVVRTLQKFIAQGVWEAGDVLGELRRHVVEVLGDEDATLIIDETGFPKKGTKSVGVARQYAGILGRTDNCQVGVFLSYHSVHGHTLCDRRLFLPEVWTNDRPRCEAAGIPPGVIFRTKPELAAEMVEQAVRSGMPCRWVTADSVYGNSPTFVRTLRELKLWYVLDVSCEAHAWTAPPEMRPLGQTTRAGGRPTTKAKPLTKPRPVSELAAEIPASAWKRYTVAEGSQGPRVYEFAELTVWFSEEGQPAPEPERLVFKRSLGQDPELKYQRSNAPTKVALKKLAEVGGGRWCVEQDFQCGKGECGLDEYETRGWIGWHHHTALSLVSLWFLTLQKARLGKKTPPAHRAGSSDRAPLPARSAALGRTRNPPLVQPPPTPQRPRQTLSRRAKSAAAKTATK
jgi:SRSO17 transposase